MALEPSSIQRDRMLSYGKTKLTLIQFLASRFPSGIMEYLKVSSQAIQIEGGRREHLLKIDQALVGGSLPYHYLTVDSFPSSQALLLAHESVREIRSTALQEIFAIYLQSSSLTRKILKSAGFLSPTLARWLGTREINEFPDQGGQLDPQTDPDLDQIKEFASRDRDRPFYMMNLNHVKVQEKTRLSGKSAYQRYSTRIIPYLVSVGGYPEIYTKILGTYIGDQRSSLFERWDDFALVYYPSRASFLRLITNTPKGAAEVRRAGLEKVVLMPCLEMP